MRATAVAKGVPHCGALLERDPILGVNKGWAVCSFAFSSRGNNIA